MPQPYDKLRADGRLVIFLIKKQNMKDSYKKTDLQVKAITGQTDLSVVIPAFNEEKRLPSTLAFFEEVADQISLEIIIVCDGCTDNTGSIIEEWSGRLPIRVISYPDNKGKGYAVRKGMLAAGGDIVAFIDADGSTPPIELIRLVRLLEKEKADVIIGSRRVPGAVIKRQNIRRYTLGRLFSFFTKAALSLPYLDTQCGCKLFKRKVARLLFRLSKYDGFEFDLDIVYLAYIRGLRIREIGITWNDIAGSKVRVIADGLKMIQTVLMIKLTHIKIMRRIKKQYLAIISML